MTSRIQILCDDSVRSQLDKLCSDLELKVSAESRGVVVSYLIQQAKELARLRGHFNSLADERDAAKAKIDELDDTVEALGDEIADLKAAVQAHQRALIFALDAAPKG